MSRLKTLPPRVAPLPPRLAPHTPGSWRNDKRTSHQRGYTYRWQQYREVWLRKHPLCGDRIHGSCPTHSRCVQAGLATPGTDVDHITPHRGDEALFWDENNHQTLCGTCHDSFKPQFERTGGDIAL